MPCVEDRDLIPTNRLTRGHPVGRRWANSGLRLVLLAAAFVVLSPPASAQDGCDEPAIEACCKGLRFWSGIDVNGAQATITLNNKVEMLQPVQRYQTYWDSYGGLEASRAERKWISIGTTAAALFLAGLFAWLFVTRRWFPWWAQVLVMALLPGLTWAFVPEVLTRSAADDAASSYVDGHLREFCKGADGAGALQCNPSSWGEVFDEEVVTRPLDTVAACEEVDHSVAQEALYVAPGDDEAGPCALYCAPALGRGELKRLVALQWYLVGGQDTAQPTGLLHVCPEIEESWRAAEGPSQQAWKKCRADLASRSFDREISRSVVLQAPWAGGAAALVVGLILVLLTRVRR